MFIWDESIHGLDVPADNVIHLFRSMRDVQLALPGISAQQASAYLCQYKQPDGIATVAAFHLQKSGILAFYCSDPRIVAEQSKDDMLNQGLNFVESMGFLLTDQDIHLMEQADLQKLWEALPIKKGLENKSSSPEPLQSKPSAAVASEKPASSMTEQGSRVAKKQPAAENASSSKPVTKQSSAVKPGLKTQPETPAENTSISKPVTKQSAAEQPCPETQLETPAENTLSENVDDLLAAVEAMRAKSTALRAHKTVPSAEEMKARKEQLRETVGRILATL